MFQKLQFRGFLRTVITYNAAISACGNGQRPQQALHMWQKLQLRGLRKGLVTYGEAISAFEKGQRATTCAACAAVAAAPKPPAPKKKTGRAGRAIEPSRAELITFGAIVVSYFSECVQQGFPYHV